MEKTKVSLAVMIAIILFASSACGPKPESFEAPPLRISQWIQGGPDTSETKAEASLQVLVFWATWCPSCVKCLPRMAELQTAYAGKGVRVIAISSEEPEDIKEFLSKREKPLDLAIAADNDSRTNNAYSVSTIPTVRIVDSSNQIIWQGHPSDGVDKIIDGIHAGTFKPKDNYCKEAAEKLITVYFYIAQNTRERDLLKQTGRTLYEYSSGNAVLFEKLAWGITNIPEGPMRDLELADKAARKALELTSDANSSALDTYAAVMFLRGYLEKALELQRKAVALGDNTTIEECTERLKKYEAAQAKG